MPSWVRFFSLGFLVLACDVIDATILVEDGVIDDSNIEEVRDCFSGEFSSADKYVDSRMSQYPQFEGNARFRDQQIDRYEAMRDGAVGVECMWMKYTVDGYEVHGFIAAPEGAFETSVEYPTVVVLRGGNADHGRFRLIRLVNQVFPLVREGFVVVGTSYRGAAESRREHHPDRLADEFGGQDLNDVLELLPIIDALPFANGRHVGLWGNSRGAMMAYMAARESDRFSALVAMAGPVDMKKELEFRPEMEEHVLSVWIPDFEERREAALRERSVIHWFEQLSEKTAILILHGTADDRVRPDGALEFAQRLQDSGRSYRLVMYEGADHGFHGFGGEVLDEVVRWFSRYLGDE